MKRVKNPFASMTRRNANRLNLELPSHVTDFSEGIEGIDGLYMVVGNGRYQDGYYFYPRHCFSGLTEEQIGAFETLGLSIYTITLAEKSDSQAKFDIKEVGGNQGGDHSVTVSTTSGGASLYVNEDALGEAMPLIPLI